ncbi:hypothetical protein Tco_1176707 [Tanacetum coccineum]
MKWIRGVGTTSVSVKGAWMDGDGRLTSANGRMTGALGGVEDGSDWKYDQVNFMREQNPSLITIPTSGQNKIVKIWRTIIFLNHSEPCIKRIPICTPLILNSLSDIEHEPFLSRE